MLPLRTESFMLDHHVVLITHDVNYVLTKLLTTISHTYLNPPKTLIWNFLAVQTSLRIFKLSISFDHPFQRRSVCFSLPQTFHFVHFSFILYQSCLESKPSQKPLRNTRQLLVKQARLVKRLRISIQQFCNRAKGKKKCQ